MVHISQQVTLALQRTSSRQYSYGASVMAPKYKILQSRKESQGWLCQHCISFVLAQWYRICSLWLKIKILHKDYDWACSTDLFTSVCICQSIYFLPSQIQSCYNHTKYTAIALKKKWQQGIDQIVLRVSCSKCILIANGNLWGGGVYRGARKKEEKEKQ